MTTGFTIVMTTCGNAEEARRLASGLVAESLAACVQIMPIESCYRWEGKIETAAECLLFCKIKAADYPQVEAAIRAGHSYATPEIVEVPISRGSSAYLAWIQAVTR